MRRSAGREQGRVMRNIARRAVQGAESLARESSSPDTWLDVGLTDSSGNWQPTGILDVTALDAPFYLSGE